MTYMTVLAGTIPQTIDQKIADLLNTWTVGDGWPVGNMVACAIALVLTVLLCGVIGLEREIRGRSAGLRTHLLVGVGSCVIMIISIYGFPALAEGIGDYKRDIARLAAQVVTGVGFLGAGAIIHRDAKTHGLTTAGTIWLSMAIGLACGSFNFILAAVATALVFMVLVFFRRIESHISKTMPLIVLSADVNEPVVTKLSIIAEEFQCTIGNLQTSVSRSDGKQVLRISFQAVFPSPKYDLHAFLTRIETEVHAYSIEVLNGHPS